MTAPALAPVLVALQRPVGYADVHPELVAADALDSLNPWPHSVVRGDGVEVVIELERPHDYDDASPEDLAREAINSTWPGWRLVKG